MLLFQNVRRLPLIFFVVAMVICNIANTQNKKGEALYIYVENDTRRIGGPGSDNAYSNGLKISYIFAEDRIPKWAVSALDHSEKLRNAVAGANTNYGFSLGHKIFTPNDISRKDLILDDRPYAAWLYFGFAAQIQNPAQSHAVEVDIGVIGPEALGKTFQNGFHKTIGTFDAEGWEHQLATEPTIQIAYQQRLRFLELKLNEKKYVDLVPFFGGGIGNVSIDAHLGGMVRLGTSLEDDLGPARPSMTNGDNFVNPTSQNKNRKSIYVFASGQGIAIARNIFLDGNTFRNSHRVKKYPFLLETEFGVVGSYKRWTGTWRFVSRSPEFEQRSRINSFASISLGYEYE